MFVHQPLGAFDLSGAEGTLTPAADALPVDVFVTASTDPRDLLREYARITGFAELPPRWAFGYMQSHRTLAGPEEMPWVARTFREKKLPCDALIYLGTEFTPSGWNTRNGEFGWKAENFPDPKRAIDEMRAQHYKVVLHIVIEGRRMSGVGGGCVHAGQSRSERTDARRQVAGRSAGAVLLAVPQAALRPRHRRHVAGSRRRPRSGVANGPNPHVLGRPATLPARTSGRSRSIATARPACSVTARSSGPATSTRSGRR